MNSRAHKLIPYISSFLFYIKRLNEQTKVQLHKQRMINLKECQLLASHWCTVHALCRYVVHYAQWTLYTFLKVKCLRIFCPPYKLEYNIHVVMFSWIVIIIFQKFVDSKNNYLELMSFSQDLRVYIGMLRVHFSKNRRERSYVVKKNLHTIFIMSLKISIQYTYHPVTKVPSFLNG